MIKGDDIMTIDIEALRDAVKRECYAAYFGGGIGPAIMDSFDADRATPQQLIDMAKRWGIDLRKFQT